MIMRTLGFLLVIVGAFLAGTLVPTASTKSLKRSFLRIDFMQIPAGKALQYRSLERDLWKPVHQLRVNKEYISSWKLYGHHFPGGDQNYQYVTVTEFPSLQAMDELHYPELFQEVHGADYDTNITMKTLDSRRLTHTNIWALLDYVDESTNKR